MSDLSLKLARSLAALLGLALAAPSAALAQMAPTGEHYAARASDTGFAGGVNSSGGYGASVPLDLPGARGGLKVPVQVVFGGRQFGAAGLGWNVPLSSIRRNVTLAHRRPANNPDASPQPREQLTLDGTALVRNAEDTAWVARRNNAQLEVRDVGGGVLEMVDGNGLRHSFSSDGGSTGPLDGGNFYLLRDIFGPVVGTHVHLDYTFGAPSLGGGVTGLSIDLASVSYNFNSMGACAKHQVNLVYDGNASSPLSLTMLGSTPLVRMHKLHAIDVTAREAAADQPQPCSGPMRSLRTYNLEYQNDVDTGQFQLYRVTMIGQENTPERIDTLPVATYTYGQVTDSDGTLNYNFRERIQSFPANADTSFAIATSWSGLSSPSGSASSSSQNFLDVNGDGRPDLLSPATPGPFFGSFPLRPSFTMTAALNKPNPTYSVQSVFTPIFVPPHDVPGQTLPPIVNVFDDTQTAFQPRQTDIRSDRNVGQRWRRIIDMNGDGRVDVVVADEVLNAWVVYLNIPHSHDPNLITWVRREIDVRPLYPYLPGIAATAAQNPDGIFLSLSRTVTGYDQGYNHCWRKDELIWIDTPQGFNKDPGCVGPADGPIDLADRTITEWDLADVNGDGYPDLVFNTAAVGQIDAPTVAPNDGLGQVGDWFQTQVRTPFDFLAPNEVKAILNVAGVHLATGEDKPASGGQVALKSGTSAFSAPITLDVGCGVTRWSSNLDSGGRSATVQECGFLDINGDGLVDRVVNKVAWLGTGDPSALFSNASIQLPGPAARSLSQLDAIDVFGHYRPHACPAQQSNSSPVIYPDTTYPIQRTNGFLDLNGDGFPDYIAFDQSSGWTAALGTGVGFAAPRRIVNSNGHFELSLEKVGCFADNPSAGTTAGLYDFYGDGQPAYIELFSGGFNIYNLDGGMGTAVTAGLITRIDNGYGASTTIAYRSAKEDTSTNHLVASPEIVVTSVTITPDEFSPPISPMLYAYGDASQYFDSALDRWVFPGYRRKVSLQNTGDPNFPGAGNAVITDACPLDPFNLNVDVDTTTRLLRYLKAGRTCDVTTLSGIVGGDPWALLTADITTDNRRIAASHTKYTARLLPAGRTGNEYCVDMLDPYDYTNSLKYDNDHRFVNQYQSFDQCAERGLALPTSMTSWRGTPGSAAGAADVITSDQILKTGSAITAFDDFGRVTDTTSMGDLADPNDDLCTHVDYAAPQTAPVRVLNAVAQQTVQDCHGVTLAKKRFEYDGLKADKAGQVTSGFVTSSTVTRYDMDTHLPLGDDIRLFDAAYDASGNGDLRGIIKFRDDRAVSQVQYNYDTFGLVVTSTVSNAFDPIGGDLRAIPSSSTFDPVTLNRTSTTDANGTVSGTSFDGFGRVVFSTVTPPGGSKGVLSSLSYHGFEVGSPDAPNHFIEQKVFTDAVPEANVDSAPGRTAKTFFDNLGRAATTEVDLGANYPNKVATVRIFDALGRVKFVTDPFEEPGILSPPYGTTYTYNTDGTPNCFIRGPGVQPAIGRADETNEIYPTCFTRFFADNTEVSSRQDPDSGLGNNGMVSKQVRRNAVGRTLESLTFSHHPGGHHGGRESGFGDDAVFGYDLLGHMTSMTRYQDPDNKANPVTTTWHYDSLGWMTKLEEPGVAAQIRTFDSWGEITQVQWCDDFSQAPCPTADRRTITRFDGRGRVTRREDQVAGQTVPETVNDFTYDANGMAVGFASNNVLGRLASATWPTAQVWFAYDPFGRVNVRAFVDTTVTPNPHHYEIHKFHDDGSEETLHLALQDTNKDDEQVNYGYDSAGRVNSVVYNFGGISQSLFSASDTNPIYDAFGRITSALYGGAQFNATYAANGRRLLTDVKVTSGDHAHSREIAFPTLNGRTPYDPVGREQQRLELFDGLGFNGTAPTALLRSYDPFGRLTTSQNLQIATNTTQDDRAFTYDPLDNILTQADASTGNPGGVSLSYQAPDFDRFCGVAYGAAATSSPACNGAVVYDGAGNITSMPTSANSVPGTSGTRTFEYFPNGAVSTVKDGPTTKATFHYDAFGGLQQLTVDTLLADQRADKYFGAYIKQRIEGSQSVFNRQIPAPGLVATKHGPEPTAPWTFAFSEPRGTRFVTDQNGDFKQGIDYQPFGEVKNPTGATPGSTSYENEQWNRRDLLAALGVVNLGARVYDPVIGRFLSRDPIIQAKSPYAFADNDPINKSDPTGLASKCVGSTNCPYDGPPVEPNPGKKNPPKSPPSAPPPQKDSGDTGGGTDDVVWEDLSEPGIVLPDYSKKGTSNPGRAALSPMAAPGFLGFSRFLTPGGGGGPSPTSSQSTGLLLPRAYSAGYDYDLGDVGQRTDVALRKIRDNQDEAFDWEREANVELGDAGLGRNTRVRDIKDPELADRIRFLFDERDSSLDESSRWRNQAALNLRAEVAVLTGPRADVKSVLSAVNQILDRQPVRVPDGIYGTRFPRGYALETAKMAFPELRGLFPRR